LIAPVIVDRSSTRHFRADDRLVVVVIIAVNKYPRDSLLIILLRACNLYLRDFLLLIEFDRIAKSTDRMRQFGLRRRMRHHVCRVFIIISTRIRDNAVVAGGQQLRERATSGLEGWFVISQCVCERRDLIRGCDWNWRLIGLLDLRFWTTDYLDP